VAEEPPCLHVLSAETNDLGTRDCSSARKNLSNRSTSGPFAFAWKLHNRGATLSSLTWPSTANFARLRPGQTSIRRHLLRTKGAASSNDRSKAWLPMLRAISSRYLFASRIHARPHLSTRQYARLVHRWVDSIGLESVSYRTHSMRRTKATQIYRKTGNLRAVQLLLGHTKLDSTVRYLGIGWMTP
jgi:hypothetical protein